MKVLACRFFFHGLFHTHRQVENGEVGANAMFIDCFCIRKGTATDCNRADAVAQLVCKGGDTGRPLAHRSLTIHAAFAGYEKIGILQCIAYADGFEAKLASRNQLAVKERMECETESAGCTGARALYAVLFLCRLGELCETTDSLIHCRDDFRRRTLLRSKYGRTVFRAT